MNTVHDVTEMLNGPMADSITIDNVPARGIFTEFDGRYEEGAKTVMISSIETVTSATVFVIRGETYGAVSWEDDGFGAVTVVLGGIL